MTIGNEMLKFRQQHGLTQQKCADACGVTLQTWYSIENDRQKPSKLTYGKIRSLLDGETKIKENKED